MANLHLSEPIPRPAPGEGAFGAETGSGRSGSRGRPGTFPRRLLASRSGLFGTSVVLLVVGGAVGRDPDTHRLTRT